MASHRQSGSDISEAQAGPIWKHQANKRRWQHKLGFVDGDNPVVEKRSRLDAGSKVGFAPATVTPRESMVANLKPIIQVNLKYPSPVIPQRNRLDETTLSLFPSSQTNPYTGFVFNSRARRLDDTEFWRHLMEQNVHHQILTAVQRSNAFATPSVLGLQPFPTALSLLGSSSSPNSCWGTLAQLHPPLIDAHLSYIPMSSSSHDSYVASHPAKPCHSLFPAQSLSHPYVESFQRMTQLLQADATAIPALSRLFQPTDLLQMRIHQSVERNSVAGHLQENGLAFEERARIADLQNDGLSSSSFQNISRYARPASNLKQSPFQSESDKNPPKRVDGACHLLTCSEDRGMLNEHLIFLRKHIEYFEATMEDILSHTKGRNKSIALGQVGIRCKHCSHTPLGSRVKGSTYFSSTLMGIYQAAQNIHVEHFQSGLCPEMPPKVKKRFARHGLSRVVASCAGKAYWADSAMKLGMIDTDDGIRFATD